MLRPFGETGRALPPKVDCLFPNTPHHSDRIWDRFSPSP